MKKMYNKTLFAFMALALSFTACSKDADLDEVAPSGEDLVELTFTASGDEDTRTYVEETGETDRPYRIRWKESGEELTIIPSSIAWGGTATTATQTGYDQETNTATFGGTVSAGNTFAAVYPSSRFKSALSADYSTVTIPSSQTPLVSGYDPEADLMGSAAGISASSNGVVAFTLQRFIAFARMSLKGISSGETIEKVEFTAPNCKIAGDAYLYHSKSPMTLESPSWATSLASSDKITLDMSNYTAAVTGEEEVVPVWFTAIPATLTSMTVKATTTDGTKQYAYEKTVDLGAGQQLKAARVARFGVAFSAENRTELGGAAPGGKKVFKKLTDDYQLKADDQIVFLYSGNNTLMSINATNDNKGFQQTTAVEVTDDMIDADVATSASAQIFTLSQATDNTKFYLTNQNGKKLYASGSYMGTSLYSSTWEASEWKLSGTTFQTTVNTGFSTLLNYVSYDSAYNYFNATSVKNDVVIYYAAEVAGGGGRFVPPVRRHRHTGRRR